MHLRDESPICTFPNSYRDIPWDWVSISSDQQISAEADCFLFTIHVFSPFSQFIRQVHQQIPHPPLCYSEAGPLGGEVHWCPAAKHARARLTDWAALRPPGRYRKGLGCGADYGAAENPSGGLETSEMC